MVAMLPAGRGTRATRTPAAFGSIWRISVPMSRPGTARPAMRLGKMSPGIPNGVLSNPSGATDLAIPESKAGSGGRLANLPAEGVAVLTYASPAGSESSDVLGARCTTTFGSPTRLCSVPSSPPHDEILLLPPVSCSRGRNDRRVRRLRQVPTTMCSGPTRGCSPACRREKFSTSRWSRRTARSIPASRANPGRSERRTPAILRS